MKTLLLSLAFPFLAMLNLQGQVAFPTNNEIWTNTQYNYVFNPPNPIPDLVLNVVSTYCVHGQDTTIQSNQYTAVYHCQNLYKGAIREVNSAVYFVPADSTDEYLLYDFSAQQGQTLQDVYVGNHFDESFILQDFTVQQTTTEIIGSVSRRVVYADNYRWIEGIGCETGLFMEPWVNVSNYENRLECFSVNNQMIFPTSGTEPCPYIFVGVNEVESVSSFELYPNPTNGDLTIAFAQIQNDVQVKIVNLVGQQMKRIAVTDTNKAELSFEGAAGVYFAIITTTNGNRSTLRFVKN